MQTSNIFLKVWGMPILLAVITITGLLLAIMGTGVWHFSSWVALLVPLYFVMKYLIKCFK